MQDALSLFKKLVDLVIPLQCVKCGGLLDTKEGLCTSCWSSISFISKPYCGCCGRPFDFEIEDNALCGACSSHSPLFTSARSVFTYSAESKHLILKFKHTDSISGAPLFAEWMTRQLEEIKDPLCIPVPLHWTRLFMRTYNQAGLLALEIAKRKDWTYAPFFLKRKRRTPSQGYLSKIERIKNVENAFLVPEKKKKQLTGKTVLLVDDVFTTGATLNACTKVLLKNGAKDVHAITLGRVVRGL